MAISLSLKDVTSSIIPISRFNRGEANKIFEEVEKSGAKIVLKNNVPACVLLSPDDYNEMLEILEDYALFFEAEIRIDHAKQIGFLSHEQVLKELGVDESELDDVDVELE